MEDDNLSDIAEGRIKDIRFSIATHDEICTSSISDAPINHPKQLTNPFLGLPLESGKCESCGIAEPGKCEGHFGYIEFPAKIYHPCHVSELRELLNLVCLNCLRLKRLKNAGSDKSSNSPCLYCVDIPRIMINDSKTNDGVVLIELKLSKKSQPPVGFWNFLDRYGYRYGNGKSRILLPCEALEILKRFSEDTRKKLSSKGYFPQDGYILEKLPVPPNCLSIPDISDGVSIMSSDISVSMLRKVLNEANAIKSSRSGRPNFESHKVEVINLQLLVAQYLCARGTSKLQEQGKMLDRTVEGGCQEGPGARGGRSLAKLGTDPAEEYGTTGGVIAWNDVILWKSDGLARKDGVMRGRDRRKVQVFHDLVFSRAGIRGKSRELFDMVCAGVMEGQSIEEIARHVQITVRKSEEESEGSYGASAIIAGFSRDGDAVMRVIGQTVMPIKSVGSCRAVFVGEGACRAEDWFDQAMRGCRINSEEDVGGVLKECLIAAAVGSKNTGGFFLSGGVRKRLEGGQAKGVPWTANARPQLLALCRERFVTVQPLLDRFLLLWTTDMPSVVENLLPLYFRKHSVEARSMKEVAVAQGGRHVAWMVEFDSAEAKMAAFPGGPASPQGGTALERSLLMKRSMQYKESKWMYSLLVLTPEALEALREMFG